MRGLPPSIRQRLELDIKTRQRGLSNVTAALCLKHPTPARRSMASLVPKAGARSLRKNRRLLPARQKVIVNAQNKKIVIAHSARGDVGPTRPRDRPKTETRYEKVDRGRRVDCHIDGGRLGTRCRKGRECVQAVPSAVSYTHLRAHETVLDLVCRLLLEKKK